MGERQMACHRPGLHPIDMWWAARTLGWQTSEFLIFWGMKEQKGA